VIQKIGSVAQNKRASVEHEARGALRHHVIQPASRCRRLAFAAYSLPALLPARCGLTRGEYPPGGRSPAGVWPLAWRQWGAWFCCWGWGRHGPGPPALTPGGPMTLRCSGPARRRVACSSPGCWGSGSTCRWPMSPLPASPC
jgi:hypothetical protein